MEIPILLRLSLILLWGFLSYRVYVHAEQRGLPAIGWALFVFLTGVLVLLIYYAFASKYPVISRTGSEYGYQPESVYRGGGPAPKTGYGQQPESSGIKADSGFIDDELERLIGDGRLREARAYLNDMMQLAKEMGDKKGLLNYRQYEQKLARASASGSRGTYGY